MKRYANLSGVSGITHYSIGEDYIEVRFTDSHQVYVYTSGLVGEARLETMKSLAMSGRGLCTYITQHPEIKNFYLLR